MQVVMWLVVIILLFAAWGVWIFKWEEDTDHKRRVKDVEDFDKEAAKILRRKRTKRS